MSRDSNDPKKNPQRAEMRKLDGGIEWECCRERRKVNAGWEGEGIEAKVG